VLIELADTAGNIKICCTSKKEVTSYTVLPTDVGYTIFFNSAGSGARKTHKDTDNFLAHGV
jgi:hypothetical protein